MSDGKFDPDAYLSESSSEGFDPDSYLSESEPSVSSNLGQAAIGATTGAALGSAPLAAAKITKELATAASPLTSPQMERVIENYDRYKQLDPSEKITDVEKLLNEYNQNINKVEKEAYSKLSAPLSRQQYKQDIVKPLFQESIAPVKLDDEMIANVELQANRLAEPSAPVSKKMSDLEDLLNKSKSAYQTKLTSEFPELQGQLLSGNVKDEEIQAVLDLYKKGDRLQGTQVYDLVRELRSQKDNKFAQKAAKELRSYINKENKEASDLFKKESELLTPLSKAEESKYLSKGVNRTAEDFISIGEKEAKRLQKDILGSIDGKTLTKEVQDNLDQFKKLLPEEAFKDLELALLKGEVKPKALTEALGEVGNKALLGTTLGVPAGVTLGARQGLKEFSVPIAKAADTLLSNKIVQNLPIVGAGLGALMSGQQAKAAVDEGSINPLEATVATGLDVINPLPLDTVGGYVEGKKAFKKTGSLLEGAKAGFQEAAKPLTEIGKMLNTAGSERSESARAQMEAQQKRLDDLLKKQQQVKENPIKQLTKPVEQYQNLLNELSSMRTPTSDSLTSVLEEAAAGDEQAKARADFLIQQDPMLRRKMS